MDRQRQAMFNNNNYNNNNNNNNNNKVHYSENKEQCMHERNA
jgi:hypothetical protein